MILTSENYYSTDADREYLSVSQYKNFIGSLGRPGCEAYAMAKLNEEWVENMEDSDALMVGSYVDAHFEGTLDVFKAQHPCMFKKDGSLMAKYIKANEMINRCERDELFIDYIKQLNGFERWLESHYLPGSAQLLYYKLLSINNMAGWCEWIQVDNQRVMSRCQMSREATLVENRNRLIDAGLIEFQRGKKGSPNKYKICTFKSVGQSVGETVVQTEVQSVGQSVGETVAIYKHKHKQNNIAPARAKKFANYEQRPPKDPEFYNALLENNRE